MPRRYGSTTSSTHEDSPLLSTAYCDHYSHNSDDDDDDDDPSGSGGRGGSGGLTPVTRRRRNRGNHPIIACCKTLLNMLLLPLILLTILTLLYSYKLQTQLSSLSSQLSTTQSRLSVLSGNITSHASQLSRIDATLANHSSVIARFETAVSNRDVLEKLQRLEEESEERARLVQEEMEATKNEIRGVLITTKGEIDDTVTTATNQINAQVLSVQSSLSNYIRATQDQFSTENSFMIYQLAGTFTILGCLISMWHMTAHLRNFHQPFVQRKILAILWMCPIYSITSWLSLVLPQLEGYLAILKDLYEAYVIYQFLSFCIAVLGKGDRTAVVELLAQHADHLGPPVICMKCCRKRLGGEICEDEKRQLADDVLLQCQVCAMQFVFLRPLLTAIMFALKKINYHGPMFGPGSPFDHTTTTGNSTDMDVIGVEHGYDLSNDEYDVMMMDAESSSGSGGGGMMDYRSPQFYIIILENVSVFVAFSGLLNFYHAVQDDLYWCRPFPKFLCIKGVVFMTFWQGIGISLLASTTDLFGDGDDDEDQVETWAKQAQNFLICLEMLGFAIAHFYCFPVEEWEEGYRPKEDKSKFGDKMALGDFLHDLKLILRHNERKKRTAKEKSGLKPNSDDSITTLLEEDEELGQADSMSDNNDGLQSLLENVEDLMESSSHDATGAKNSIAAEEISTNPASKVPSDTTPSRPYRKSIQETLESMNAPSELREATALLLQSSLLDEDTARLLTSDILDQPLEEEAARGSLEEKEEEEGEGRVVGKDEMLGRQESKQSSDEDYIGVVDMDESADSTTEDNAIESTEDQNEAQPSESTTLLSAPSINDEMLRPSIFTIHPTTPPKD